MFKIPNNTGRLPEDPLEFPLVDDVPACVGVEFETNGANPNDVLNVRLGALGFGTHHTHFCTGQQQFRNIENRLDNCGCSHNPAPGASVQCSGSGFHTHISRALRALMNRYVTTGPVSYPQVVQVLGNVLELHSLPELDSTEQASVLSLIHTSQDMNGYGYSGVINRQRTPAILKLVAGTALGEPTQGRDQWIGKTDPTCGNETVSPILPVSNDSLRTIHNMATALDDIGEEANASCGCHIHISRRALGFVNGTSEAPKKIASFTALYTMLEPLLALAVSCNRYSPGSYNPTLFQGRSRKENIMTVLRGWGNGAGGSLANYDFGRPWLSPYSRHDTFEFRGFEGTTSGEDVTMWIKLLLRLIQAHTHSNKWEAKFKALPSIQPSARTVRGFLQYLDLYGRGGELGELREWYMGRAKAFWPNPSTQANLVQVTTSIHELNKPTNKFVVFKDSKTLLESLPLLSVKESGRQLTSLVRRIVASRQTTETVGMSETEVMKFWATRMVGWAASAAIDRAFLSLEQLIGQDAVLPMEQRVRTELAPFVSQLTSAFGSACLFDLEEAGSALMEARSTLSTMPLSFDLGDRTKFFSEVFRTCIITMYRSNGSTAINDVVATWTSVGDEQCVEF